MGKFIKFATLWLSLSFISSVALARPEVTVTGLINETCEALEFYLKCFVPDEKSEGLVLSNEKSCNEQDKESRALAIGDATRAVVFYYKTPLLACMEKEELGINKILCFKKYSQIAHDTHCKSTQAPNPQG